MADCVMEWLTGRMEWVLRYSMKPFPSDRHKPPRDPAAPPRPFLTPITCSVSAWRPYTVQRLPQDPARRTSSRLIQHAAPAQCRPRATATPGGGRSGTAPRPPNKPTPPQPAPSRRPYCKTTPHHPPACPAARRSSLPLEPSIKPVQEATITSAQEVNRVRCCGALYGRPLHALDFSSP